MLRILACTFVNFLVIVVSLSLYSRHGSIKLPLGLCIPFADPQKSVAMFQAVTHVIVICQVLCSAAIPTFHLLLFSKVHESQISIRKTKADQTNILSLLLQLVLMTCCSLVCWLPTSVIYTILMFAEKYPLDIVYWTMVLLVPFNGLTYSAGFIFACVRRNAKKGVT